MIARIVQRLSAALREGLSRSWRFEGTIDRLPFLTAGLSLFLAKWLLDSTVAAFFGKSWNVFNYLAQEQVALYLVARQSFGTDWSFFAVMLTLAIPFVAAGISLILQRLRAVHAPLALAALFFVPFINFLFFMVLSVTPSRSAPRTVRSEVRARGEGLLGRVLPSRPLFSAGAAIAATTLLGLLYSAFSVYALQIYGVGLFVGVPFCMGILCTVIYGYHADRSVLGSMGVAATTAIILEFALFITNLEGAVCLLMALPLLVGCAAIGGLVGYFIRGAARDEREALIIVIGLTLIVPALLGLEYTAGPDAPVYEVVSTISVPSPLEEVWNRVVSFPDLPPPDEWIFRAGVAFPTGATITGEGVGAVRRCSFSTGDFLEPIEVWDEPRLLRFAVTQNPPPLREWSLYRAIDPPHLGGFLVLKRGQFLLSSDERGKSILQGTTWYSHNMWPAGYWRLWSDYMIHRIHMRVLNHIRELCENDNNVPLALR